MTPNDRRDFLKSASGAAAFFAISPNWMPVPRLASNLSVGVIGVGRQGRAILAELGKFEDVTVAAICDTDDARLRSGARRAAEAQPHPEHSSLLSDESLDAVVIATPTHAHKDLAIAALAAGKHVYCEAPLAHTVDDAQAIAQAARAASSVFQTGMLGRCNPVYKLARTFVRSGAIGDIVGLRGQYHKKTSWRTPASDPAREAKLNWRVDPKLSTGLLGEFGTQQFDVLHWFTGKYPSSVRASGSVRAWDDGREVDDTVQCQLNFPKGMACDYDATLGNSFEGQFELLMGTMGSVKLSWTHGWMFKEADAPTQGWEVYANRQRFHNDEGITLIADATKLSAQGKLKEGIGLPHPPLYYGMESFLKSATEGQPVACGADEGLRAAIVGIRAHEASAANEELPIELSGEQR
ncbi:MAG: putative dehydrogenase [Chlamydiales bacterium]|jgi:predicted dehydrogenase